MGFFSWLTADKKQSIRIGKQKKVFLLQPNNIAPIEESCYEGCGMFGTTDAYEWLAENNLPSAYINKAKTLIQSNPYYKMRNLGVALDCGKYLIDSENNKYCNDSFVAELFSLHYFDDYESELNGISFNRLIKQGVLKENPTKDLIGGIKFPLKFSYSKKSIYEELKPSRNCPDQGYW